MAGTGVAVGVAVGVGVGVDVDVGPGVGVLTKGSEEVLQAPSNAIKSNSRGIRIRMGENFFIIDF
jgi:hypothetical protein